MFVILRTTHSLHRLEKKKKKEKKENLLYSKTLLCKEIKKSNCKSRFFIKEMLELHYSSVENFGQYINKRSQQENYESRSGFVSYKSRETVTVIKNFLGK